MSDHNRFNNLPNELRNNIFKELTLKDTGKAMFVCKNWHKCITNVTLRERRYIKQLIIQRYQQGKIPSQKLFEFLGITHENANQCFLYVAKALTFLTPMESLEATCMLFQKLTEAQRRFFMSHCGMGITPSPLGEHFSII